MRYLAAFLGMIAIGSAGMPAVADDAPTDEQLNLFDTMDADENGRLSAAEIPEAQARHFGRLVRVGDQDGDGELTREEFLSATQERNSPVTEPARRGQGRGPQRGRAPMRFIPIDQLFERFDANNDDKLTLEEIPDEMRPGLEPMYQRRNTDELTREQLVEMRDSFFNSGQVMGMLRRLDENGNGDGTVTLSEVPERFRPRLDPLFERFGGEELDLERVAGAMQQPAPRQPQGDQPSQRRPEGDRPPPALLRALDSDGNGRISREELAAAAEQFDQLDLNGDDQIDARELFGVPPRDGARPDAQQPRQRPQRPEGARDRRQPPDATGRPRRPGAEDDN
jgi:Ca2+-binding EF-hand superfamily protein